MRKKFLQGFKKTRPYSTRWGIYFSVFVHNWQLEHSLKSFQIVLWPLDTFEEHHLAMVLFLTFLTQLSLCTCKCMREKSSPNFLYQCQGVTQQFTVMIGIFACVMARYCEEHPIPMYLHSSYVRTRSCEVGPLFPTHDWRSWVCEFCLIHPVKNNRYAR